MKEQEKNKNLNLTKLILAMTDISYVHENKMMMISDKEEQKEKEKEDQNLGLPHELIVEILLRLPIRSLLRFKCVSTSWRSLISNPHFTKSHFDLVASPAHRLLLNRISDGSEIQSFD